MLIIYAILASIYGQAPMYAVNFPGEIPDPIFSDREFFINLDLATGTKVEGLSGPESVVEYESNLYTGLSDGRIVKIKSSDDGVLGAGNISDVAFVSIPGIPTTKENSTIGRPLGMRNMGEMLYVADTTYGIYAVNVSSGELTVLVQTTDVSPPLSFPNDVEVSDEALYFTDVSAKFNSDQLPYIVLEGTCDGRVLKYDFLTGEVTTVMENLCSPNSLQMTPDKTKLFITENVRNRVRIVDTMVWETIKLVYLPTYTDNIRMSNHGTYLVAGSVRITYNTIIIRRQPAVRQWLASAYTAQQLMAMSDISFNAVFELDEEGKVLKSFYDPRGTLTHGLSHASQLSDGRMVLGSYVADYMSFANVEW